MPMEQETLGLVVGGFSVVLSLMILATLYLWFKNKSNNVAYISVLSHLVLLSTAIFFLVKAISFDFDHPMASEEISLRIGLSGIIWTASMICLVLGLFKLSNHKRTYES